MMALSRLDASRIVLELVSNGGWRNSAEAIAEAIPHMVEHLGPADVISTLENLKIPYAEITCREDEITSAECPAMVFPHAGRCFVALGREGRKLITSQDDLSSAETREPSQQWCLVIRIDRFAHRVSDTTVDSVIASFGALRPMMPLLLVSSFLTNLLGLSAPLLIMAIYDRVIPTNSVNLLGSLSVGVAIILATDFGFRHARTNALAYAGRKGEQELSIALFRKLMAIPLHQLQRSEIDQQLTRFRQFEALRDIFTGQVMTTLLDLPFALIFFAVLLYLAPPVGLLTIGVIVFFALSSAVTIPIQQRLDMTASEASAATRALFHDAVRHQRTIVGLGISGQFFERSEPLVEASEAATRRARQLQRTRQLVAQSVSSLATVGAIVISANAALVGDMSFGALIAVIALVSKVLAPFNSLHSNLDQILSFLQSRSQADRVLALSQELELGLERAHQKTLSGAISINAITHRPDPLTPPLLSQVSFEIEPGEFVVVMGSDTASKTSLLDLIDGLVMPISGTIEFDGIDIRQIARDELRHSITYATFEPAVFYGTIEQNFRLASPLISKDQVIEALETMDLLNDFASLPEGLETRFTDRIISGLPNQTLRALALARSIARRSSIYMFSEPTNGMSVKRRTSFKAWIEAERGNRTIVVSTADRSLIKLADRCIFLNGGRLAVNDTGLLGQEKINAILKAIGG